jgi:hypothetical protein
VSTLELDQQQWGGRYGRKRRDDLAEVLTCSMINSSAKPVAGPSAEDYTGQQTGVMRSVVMRLPTQLVARYRAVDRERIGSALLDTPSHLAALTDDIRLRGILVPLRLGFNCAFAVLDGNHRIAVALRLGLDDVPVALFEEAVSPRPSHAQPMHPSDLAVLTAAIADPDSGSWVS